MRRPCPFTPTATISAPTASLVSNNSIVIVVAAVVDEVLQKEKVFFLTLAVVAISLLKCHFVLLLLLCGYLAQ